MNAFLELAARQIPAPVKTRHRTDAPRAARTSDIETAREGDHQLKAWKQWRRERLDRLLAGPHRQAVRELIQFLQAMTIRGAPALIAFVERTQWRRAEPETRFDVLALIDAHIIKLREPTVGCHSPMA